MELKDKENLDELDGKIVRLKKMILDGEEVLIGVDLTANEEDANIYFIK